MVKLSSFCIFDVLSVARGELRAVQFVEVGNFERVEQVPVLVILNSLHELVRNPDSCIGSAGTTVGIAGVVAEFKELGEIEVPVLHIERERPKLLSSTANCAEN